MTHFNQKSNEWDTPEKITLNEKYSNRIKALIPLKNKNKILDLGCGTGLLISNFRNMDNTLIGVDTSEGMLDIFNKKFKDDQNAKSYLLNLEDNDFNESQFDLIVSSMAFHHLKRPDLMISKLSPLLNEGGFIAIIDLDEEDGSFHPDPKNMGVYHSGFSKEETELWAKKAKFKNCYREIIHTIEKNNNHYPVFMTIFSNQSIV